MTTADRTPLVPPALASTLLGPPPPPSEPGPLSGPAGATHAIGAYIEVEGPDGCGKSTQAMRLARALAADGHRTRLSQQPTFDTPIGALIRRVLRGEEKLHDRHTMPLLFAADRMEYSVQIRAWVEAGHVVIGDRGALSTWAYATATARAAGDPYADGVSHWADSLSDWALRPSLVLVLDVPAEECARRRVARGGKRELYEHDDLQRHVRDCYAEARRTSLGAAVRFVLGTGSVEDVEERLVAVVREHLRRRS